MAKKPDYDRALDYALIEKSNQEEVAQKARMQREHALRTLVDAWSLASPPQVLSSEASGLTSIIKDKIEYHKKMIATLEWFGAHVSLDTPDNVLVTRVIMEGLAALEKHRVTGGPEYAPWK